MRSMLSGPLRFLNYDGPLIDDSTSEELIYPVYPVPAHGMNDGIILALRVFGKISTNGTPTITFRIRWGGLAGTVLGLTEALTNGSGVTNVNWLLEAMIQSRANGITGTLLCTGKVSLHTAAGTLVQNVFSVSGFDAPAPVTINHEAAADLAVTGQWSAAHASNVLTPMSYQLKAEN